MASPYLSPLVGCVQHAARMNILVGDYFRGLLGCAQSERRPELSASRQRPRPSVVVRPDPRRSTTHAWMLAPPRSTCQTWAHGPPEPSAAGVHQRWPSGSPEQSAPTLSMRSACGLAGLLISKHFYKGVSIGRHFITSSHCRAANAAACLL